jgi:hypothetical protein
MVKPERQLPAAPAAAPHPERRSSMKRLMIATLLACAATATVPAFADYYQQKDGRYYDKDNHEYKHDGYWYVRDGKYYDRDGHVYVKEGKYYVREGKYYDEDGKYQERH